MLKHDHIETMMKGERISKLWEEVHNRKWTDVDVDATKKVKKALWKFSKTMQNLSLMLLKQ